MLKKIQAWTGLIFATFVALHLVNTLLGAFGPGVYDAVQAELRAIYQFTPLEVLLLAAGATHAVVGVMRIVQEPKRALNLRAKLHRYAGFFLLIVIAGHVLAVRGPSWFYDVFPRWEGVAFAIEYAPYYFYPYYFLLGFAGFFHMTNGLGIALGRLGAAVTVSTSTLKNASAMVAVGLVVALLGFGGVFYDPGPVAESDFARLAAELVGIDLEGR